MNIDDLLYETYFEELISNLNKAIEDLNVMKNKFEDEYILNKFEDELIKILERRNDQINSNDLNELIKIYKELLNKYEDPITKFKLMDLFDSLRNSMAPKDDKNLEAKINKQINDIFTIIKDTQK